MLNRDIKNEYIDFKFSLQSIVAGIILSASFFLIVLDFNKDYESTIKVLVILKSESANKSGISIISNLEELPKTLFFYESLIKNNSDLKDIAIGKSKDERKEIWNKILEVERTKEDNSILDISINSKKQGDASLLVQKTVRNFFDIASKYYNVKEDVDFRIIDGPITKPKTSGFWWMIPLSALLGFISAFFFQKLILFFESKISNRFNTNKEVPEEVEIKNVFEQKEEKNDEIKKLYEIESSDAPFSFDEYVLHNENKNIPKEEEMIEIERHVQKNMYPNFPEMPVTKSASGSAPSNLPIADESFLIPGQKPEKIEEAPKHHEPTQEELKKRLNDLLKGRM